MEETLALLRETARVAAGEGGEAARLAADGDEVRSCAQILDEALQRLAALAAEPPRAAVPAGQDGEPRERAIRCAAVGAIALSAALQDCPDADAEARGLASRLLVLLRGVLDGQRRKKGPKEAPEGLFSGAAFSQKYDKI